MEEWGGLNDVLRNREYSIGLENLEVPLVELMDLQILF